MANSESLGVYWGGFLYNCECPVEAYLNKCSHACTYCFANLNDPNRQANIKQATNLLADLWKVDGKGEFKRKSYAAWLLREGYPVNFSNRVDPLANSNWFQAKPLMELFNAMGIHTYYMTRFGKPDHTEEFFDLLERPSGIYCSVTTLNEAIAKRNEPGSPDPYQRLEYVRKATDLGHSVNVGINPIVPGWIDDPDEIVKAVKDAGAWGIFVQKLHFSRRQIKNMTPKMKEALGDEVIDYGLNYLKHSECSELYDAVKASCVKYGMPFYNSQQSEPTTFFDKRRELYDKGFPLMQDFVNTCHELLEDGDYITWEDFRDYFVPSLPPGEWSLRDHINSLVVPQALYGKHIPQRMTYEKLLYYCWKHKETILCPANVDCFAWAADPDPSGKKDTFVRVVDNNNMPILVFKPNGTNHYAYTINHDL